MGWSSRESQCAIVGIAVVGCAVVGVECYPPKWDEKRASGASWDAQAADSGDWKPKGTSNLPWALKTPDDGDWKEQKPDGDGGGDGCRVTH